MAIPISVCYNADTSKEIQRAEISIMNSGGIYMGFEFRKEYVKDYVAPYGQEIMHGKIALEEHYESPQWEATGDPGSASALQANGWRTA